MNLLPKHGPEISDRIVCFDLDSLERKPVEKEEVIREFVREGNLKAAGIVQGLPERDGVLESDAVDRLLIAVHCEMQRLSEEFQHGRRVFELLKTLVTALRCGETAAPIRVVDIGCGTGFVIRWMAALGDFGPQVELIGADYNAALVGEAERLARIEGLDCSFVVANAFRLEPAASIYISTALLHHFRGDDLIRFFRQHQHPDVRAFMHFDFQASTLGPLGSWLFHQARMRQPLSKHDGVLSAVRAHSAAGLLQSARAGAPEFVSAIYNERLGWLPLKCAFPCVLGTRPEYRERLLACLGNKAARLGAV